MQGKIMIMHCPNCGEVEVRDEVYELQRRAKEQVSMHGGSWIRCHPLTCECGLFLMDKPSTPRPYDECECWPQCSSCSHYEWYMHECVLMLDITKPKRREYLEFKGK